MSIKNDISRSQRLNEETLKTRRSEPWKVKLLMRLIELLDRMLLIDKRMEFWEVHQGQNQEARCLKQRNQFDLEALKRDFSHLMRKWSTNPIVDSSTSSKELWQILLKEEAQSLENLNIEKKRIFRTQESETQWSKW